MLLLLIVGLLDGIEPDLRVVTEPQSLPENDLRPDETRPNMPRQPSGYG